MFGRLGWVEIAVIGLVLLVFFGRGKIGGVLGELGRGVKAFKEGMQEGGGGSKKGGKRRK